MARMAPVSHQPGNSQLPKNAPAIRTIVGNLLAQAGHLSHVAQYAFGNLCFDANRVWNWFALSWALLCILFEQETHFRNWNAMIYLQIIQSALRHFRVGCVFW